MAEVPYLMAPNEQDEIARTMAEHPEIDTMDEVARGEIISITAARLNGSRDKPWGRKARSNDPANPNLNTDGMCYLRPDGLFEIIDVISGSNGSATWDECGAFAAGENGYFYPVPGDSSGDLDTLKQQLQQLQTDVAILQTDVATLTNAMSDMTAQWETAISNGLHCHGPVDLPIVMESLTSLRCKGDISVEVKPGHATPPEPSSDEPPTLLDVALLKKILGRLRP